MMDLILGMTQRMQSGPLTALIVALAAMISITAQASEADGVFYPQTFTLDNGMEIVVVVNDRAPVVSHMVWYKVGSADDPPGKSGLAHFTEHLMFKGTKDVAPQEFSKIVARNGGRDNAFTSYDYTAYFQNIAADRLGLMMEMEADRMANLTFDEEIVATERNVVIEERKQVVESVPSRRFGEILNASQFVHHPYGTPIIGWLHEQESYTLDDARRFYETWYAPNNAILVVVGAVDPEHVRELAEQTYGKIPARDVPVRARLAEPPALADKQITFRHDDVQQPSIQRVWTLPGWNQEEGRPHYHAMQVLSEIMGGGKTSRLYRSLVVEQEIATSAGLYYDGDSLDLGGVTAFASPAPGVDVEAVETALSDAFADLLKDGVTEEEVADARQRLTDSAVFARDSLFGPASVIGRALSTGGTVDDIETWPARINEVTVEQVQAAAVFAFKDRPSVTGYLLPQEAALSQ